jgi:hypothetical protein
MPIDFRVGDSMIVPFTEAVVDVGHALDYSVFDFLRSRHVNVPVILSAFFREQFSKAAIGLSSQATVSLYMAQILNYAVAFQNRNKQTEVIAALTTLAQTYDLDVDDVLEIYRSAVAKVDTLIMTSSSNYLAAATLAGTTNSYDAHSLLIGGFDYDPDDFLKARMALTTVLDEIPQSADIVAIATTLNAATSEIKAFQRVKELTSYRTNYPLPRTPMSLGALTSSIRQYQPDSYKSVKLPKRVATYKSNQYKYHTLDATFAGKVSVADVMATLQAIDIELFALPVPNMAFSAYVDQAVISSDVPFSPALLAPGKDLRSIPEFQDLLKLCLLADVISVRGSQILAFAISYIDKYRMTETNAKFFAEVKTSLAALITIVEHPLQIRALLEAILQRTDHLSLREFDTTSTGSTPAQKILPRESVSRWISARAKGLQPLMMRAVDAQSSGVLFSLAIANSLPPIFEFKLPNIHTIGMTPWYSVSEGGSVSVPRIPVTREYRGAAVFTSVPSRNKLDSRHAGALSRLIPSVTTHSAFTICETPILTSEMIGSLVAHFPLDELANFGLADQAQPLTLEAAAALRHHALASTKQMIRATDSPLLLAISAQNFDQLSVQDGTWSDVVNIVGTSPIPVLTDVPILDASQMYAVSDPNFVVLFLYDNPIRHERSGVSLEQASSAAPIFVLHRQPVEHPVFVPLEQVLAAKMENPATLKPLVLDIPKDPISLEKPIRHKPASLKTDAAPESDDDPSLAASPEAGDTPS